MYLDEDWVARHGKWREYKNQTMLILPGKSNRRAFSTLVSKYVIDQNMMDAGAQTFYIQNNHEGIVTTSNFNSKLSHKYGLENNEFIEYAYALLNSKEYQQLYKGNLQKRMPQIPKLKNIKGYAEIGKKLMNLHLNYEIVPMYDRCQISYYGKIDYRVKKMKFAKKRNAEGKLEKDWSKIIFNNSITIENIPEKAYEYIVNGKSAIEWIMDQYQVKTDKKSGITDDPNDYSDDPKYIFDLLLRIINVSIQTVDLINELPPLEIEN